MPGNTKLTGITLIFNRTAAQEADLQALLAAQQAPSSPLYHHWLTPDQFAARFGMADADIQAVERWIEQRGFTVDSVNRSHNAIRFSGTVSQVESAFSTEMHYYSVSGEKHVAASTELSLPATLAPVVTAIRNLDDFRPKPQHISLKNSGARPSFTSGQSGSVFFAPGDIKVTYDINPLIQSGYTGAGQTIAIMGQSSITLSDIEAFQTAAGLSVKDPTLVLVPDTGDSATASGDESESDLDLEWSSAIATGANILFVYTGNSSNNSGVFDSLSFSVDEDLAPILSVSYGACETQFTSTDITSYENVGAQAASQGQTVIAASGDQGSTACSGTTSLSQAEQEALAVNYPASSAYATGVGGTEIIPADSVSTNSTYWTGETSGTDIVTSALTYIPEVAWNDDSSTNGLSSSGGGASTLMAQPAWQTTYFSTTGETNPSSAHRLVPDLALYSSPDYPGYLYCTSDDSAWSSGQQASCNDGFRDLTSLDLTIAGGTSFATPIFAGMLAIINQDKGYTTGQGLINPTLYTLAANGTTYASAFHDVTSGNNDCTAGSSYCSGTPGFAAGTGYDEVTGLGSVDLSNLASAWPTNSGSGAGLIGTTTTISASNPTPALNASVTFTITVAELSGSGTPSGTVNLSIDGGGTAYSSGGTQTTVTLAANGTATYTTSFSNSGTHSVIAKYVGNTTYGTSTSAASVTVGTATGTGSFSVSATPATLSVSQGASGKSTVTVTPADNYTGTVSLSLTSSNDTALANLCYGWASSGTSLSGGDGTVTITNSASGTDVLTLDTNASDCSTSAAIAKTRMHPFRLASRRPLPSIRKSAPKRPINPSRAAVGLLGLLMAGFLGRYPKKLRVHASVLALMAVLVGMSACGGGGGSSSKTTTVANTATPTFSLSPGTYTAAQTVALSDSTPGAKIYYTTDGSTPTTQSTAYTASIQVASTETIKAVAEASGDTMSGVATATYTIQLPATANPTFTPAPGTYTSPQSVSISDTTSGAAIYYTTDGSTPTTSSTTYSTPLTVSATETIQALAVAAGDTASGVTSGTYTITPANPAKGTYTITVTGTDSANSAITATTSFTFIIN